METHSEKPLISIITIVYNGMPDLKRCMASVLGQSYDNLEYIIIDGGSDDGSAEEIERQSWRLAYWCSEKDAGISDAFNKGLKHCKGEIIGMINADDWYEEKTLEKVVNNISDHDILHGDMCVYEQGEQRYIWKGNADHLEKDMSICHPTVFFKKEILDSLRGFRDYKYAMDYDFLLRAKKEGFSFLKLDEVLANFSLSGAADLQWKQALKEVFEIKESVLGHDPKHLSEYNMKIIRKGSGKLLDNLGLRALADKFRRGAQKA